MGEEHPLGSMRHISLVPAFSLVLGLFLLACSGSTPKDPAPLGSGGLESTGGAVGSGGDALGSGGELGSGGIVGTGGGDGSGGSEPVILPPSESSEAPERAGFTLLWQDDFDAIDTTRWGTGSHTFTENAAQFDPSMVTVADGYLRLGLEKDPTPGEREYMGGEIRTTAAFTYGRFETRARFAPGTGVVSSFFTYYDHWADANLPENWNEIDIEFLGKDTASVQWNVIHWNASKQRTTHEEHADLAFNPSAEFHDYAIEWLPDRVNFYIDDELLHTQTEQVQEQLNLESKLMMNIWPVNDVASLNSWAGKFDPAILPTAAYYDWVRVYSYTP